MQKWRYGLIGAVVAFIVASVSPGIAAAPDPGTSADPIVTKSYVDQAVSKATGATGQVFKVVELNAGQKITGYEGTEMVVRLKYTAEAYSPNSNGLSDLTNGLNVASGTMVGDNHLLLFPRSDGRGLKITGHTFVLVKGQYTLN